MDVKSKKKKYTKKIQKQRKMHLNNDAGFGASKYMSSRRLTLPFGIFRHGKISELVMKSDEVSPERRARLKGDLHQVLRLACKSPKKQVSNDTLSKSASADVSSNWGKLELFKPLDTPPAQESHIKCTPTQKKVFTEKYYSSFTKGLNNLVKNASFDIVKKSKFPDPVMENKFHKKGEKVLSPGFRNSTENPRSSVSSTLSPESQEQQAFCLRLCTELQQKTQPIALKYLDVDPTPKLEYEQKRFPLNLTSYQKVIRVEYLRCLDDIKEIDRQYQNLAVPSPYPSSIDESDAREDQNFRNFYSNSPLKKPPEIETPPMFFRRSMF